MMDRQTDGPSDEIDDFIVMLSYCESNRIASYSGKNKIAEMNLSYELQCINFEDCFETSPPPVCENGVPLLETRLVTASPPNCVYVYD